jgi:hypothetical protein
MTTMRFSPRMCAFCGYTFDAASGLDHEHPAKDDDVSICLNCGLIHLLDGGRFRPATKEEIAAFPAYLRREIARAERARRLARLPDLTQRGGRA